MSDRLKRKRHELALGWNFKALLRKRVRVTWGWAKVLSTAHIVQICNQVGLTRALLSVQLCVSQVRGNEWGALGWPIEFSQLHCDKQTRMRLHRGALPTGPMYFVFCRFYFSPGHPVISLLLTYTVSRARDCLSIWLEKFRVSQKEDECGNIIIYGRCVSSALDDVT
jgi:hypothetical protein